MRMIKDFVGLALDDEYAVIVGVEIGAKGFEGVEEQ